MPVDPANFAARLKAFAEKNRSNLAFELSTDPAPAGAQTASITYRVVAPTPTIPPPVLERRNLVFDGTIASAQLIPHEESHGLAAATITALVRIARPAERAGVIAKDESGTKQPGHVNVWWGPGWEVRLQAPIGYVHKVAAPSGMQPGTLSHVAVTLGPDGFSLHVDGIERGRDAVTVGLDRQTVQWTLGAEPLTSSTPPLALPFNGSIVLFRLYSGQLSAAAIASLAAKELSDAATALSAVTSRDPTLYITGSGGPTDESGNSLTVVAMEEAEARNEVTRSPFGEPPPRLLLEWFAEYLEQEAASDEDLLRQALQLWTKDDPAVRMYERSAAAKRDAAAFVRRRARKEGRE